MFSSSLSLVVLLSAISTSLAAPAPQFGAGANLNLSGISNLINGVTSGLGGGVSAGAGTTGTTGTTGTNANIDLSGLFGSLFGTGGSVGANGTTGGTTNGTTGGTDNSTTTNSTGTGSGFSRGGLRGQLRGGGFKRHDDNLFHIDVVANDGTVIPLDFHVNVDAE